MGHDRDDCPRRHNAEPPGSHPDCTCRCAVDRCREPRSHGTEHCFEHARQDGRYKADDQVVADMDDVEMMRRPHLWPLIIVLPLKRVRNGGPPEPAVLTPPHASDDGTYHVFEGMTVFGALDEVVERAYASPEEIAADGWVVD